MDPNDPVTVYTVSNPVEAEIIKNALWDEGIACVVEGMNQAAEAGLMALEIKIQVPGPQAMRAREFITEHERNRGKPEAQDQVSDTMTFTAAEQAVCHILVDLALAEDLGVAGDVTGQALVAPEAAGRALLVARVPGVLAGLEAAALVFRTVDPDLVFEPKRADGDALDTGTVLARVSGPLQALLAAERTALNFVQRLSGIATLTRRHVDALAGLPALILDTRKTTPGWRALEKYAVRCGGGDNHRTGLFDMILVKDNHIASLAGLDARAQVAEALRRAQAFRAESEPGLLIEVEVDTLEQLDAALAAGPDVILLDNMSAEQLREASRRRAAVAPKVLLEASGGINLRTVRAVAETGVDRISVGALTHSAPALDIALDFELTEAAG